MVADLNNLWQWPPRPTWPSWNGGKMSTTSHDTVSFTHVWLAAVRSASVAAHFGRLHRLSQWDGVRLVLFVHVLAVIVLWLAVLDHERGTGVKTWSIMLSSIKNTKQWAQKKNINFVPNSNKSTRTAWWKCTFSGANSNKKEPLVVV